jgi:hypothetical protein
MHLLGWLVKPVEGVVACSISAQDFWSSHLACSHFPDFLTGRFSFFPDWFPGPLPFSRFPYRSFPDLEPVLDAISEATPLFTRERKEEPPLE